MLRENLRQDLLEFFRRDDVLQPGPVLVVLRHGDVEEILGAFAVGEFVEVRRGERVGHLAGAVGAEVVENHGIVVANQSDGLRRQRLRRS